MSHEQAVGTEGPKEQTYTGSPITQLRKNLLWSLEGPSHRTFLVLPSEDVTLPELQDWKYMCLVHLKKEGMDSQEGDWAGTTSLVSLSLHEA